MTTPAPQAALLEALTDAASLLETIAHTDFRGAGPFPSDVLIGRAKADALDAAVRARAAIAQAEAAQPVEPLTRFCPGCGSVGPVPAEFRDCCPDGGHARMVPESLAQRCHDLFQLALRAPSDPDEVRAAPQPAKTAPNLACKSVQKRLATQWGYVPAEAAPKQEAVALKPMTPERAAYFMERFLHEEKLLGPNEQAALSYVIAMLEKSQPQQPAPVPVAPGWQLPDEDKARQVFWGCYPETGDAEKSEVWMTAFRWCRSVLAAAPQTPAGEKL